MDLKAAWNGGLRIQESMYAGRRETMEKQKVPTRQRASPQEEYELKKHHAVL